MKIVTASEMRQIDRITTERYGIPSLTLMENAGEGVAHFILRFYSRTPSDSGPIAVICGKGNNGGDGLVVARKLYEHLKEVTVVLLARPEEVKGDAKLMLDKLPFPPLLAPSLAELKAHGPLFAKANLIVDAIFGTGFRPPLPEFAAAAIDLIGRSSAKVVSVDLPSGADADRLALEHPNACRSDGIVSFTAPKPALIFGALTRGAIALHGIGSPQEAIVSSLGLEWNQVPKIVHRPRPLNSNKGLYGHALIIGGCLGKSGAPTMASAAALRIGAGLVTCAIPRSVLPMVAGAIPELMTEPLEENAKGAISETALQESALEQLLERKTVVALGPGIGRDRESVQSIQGFVPRCPLPLVLDADGLNAFQGRSEQLDGRARPLILTPHPGEMARLVGKSVREIEDNRIEIARSFAQDHHLILVLKGWRTLIADPEGQVWVNTTGNPGLAKGGSGDVLTGAIAGFIAQFPDRLVDAVRAAVYVHGLAADFALGRQTENTMLASDVIAEFPAVFRSARRIDDGFIWIQRDLEGR